jgi:hypothetical protein
MADTIGRLAYDEAKSAITAQASVLDGLRARAGTLLAAASLVTSFLGGQVLAKPQLASGVVSRPSIGTEGWAAIVCFVGLAVLALAILWPYKWRFVLSAGTILSNGESSDFEGAQKELAEYHETNHDLNEDKLGRLFWCFRFACALLVAETIAWILDLSG